jgi:hypothetical protein
MIFLILSLSKDAGNHLARTFAEISCCMRAALFHRRWGIVTTVSRDGQTGPASAAEIARIDSAFGRAVLMRDANKPAVNPPPG